MTQEVTKALCDERTQRITDKIEALGEGQHETYEAVVEIRRLLLGNGQPGLFERVREVEEWRQEQMEMHATIRKTALSLLNSRSMWKVLAAAIAGAAGAGGIAAFW